MFLQSLYFKFSGAPEALHIFTTLGVEPYGRLGLGAVELITAILLLIPRTALYGAWLGTGIMIGAIFSHLAVLGVVVDHDGGKLLILAIVTLVCCVAFLLLNKKLTS